MTLNISGSKMVQLKEVSPPPPAKLEPRANLARLKAGFQKLGLKIAHALNIKCEIAPPRRRNEQNVLERNLLASLSRDEMNSMGSMSALVDYTAKNPASIFGREQILTANPSDRELYRLFKNIKSHDEMIEVLREQCRAMSSAALNPHEEKLLDFLLKLHNNLVVMKREVEALNRDGGVTIDTSKVEIGTDEKDFLTQALKKARDRAQNGDDAHPGILVKTELFHATHGWIEANGTHEQKELVKQLKTIESDLMSQGNINVPVLNNALIKALCKLGQSKDEAKYNATVVCTILTNTHDASALSRLTVPLFEALSDQLYGSTLFQHDLARAFRAIENSQGDFKSWQVPELASKTSRGGVLVAIHDLAHFASRWVTPDESREATTHEFTTTVETLLKEQNFKGEWAQAFMAHARELTLKGPSEGLRKIMIELLSDPEWVNAKSSEGESSESRVTSDSEESTIEGGEPTGAPEPALDTAESLEESGPAPESRGIVESYGRISTKDSLVFDRYVLKYFREFEARDKPGDKLQFESEIKEILKKTPRADVAHIRNFFIRHAWIPALLQKSHTKAQQDFGGICRSFAENANQIVSGESLKPVLWVNRQARKIERFETILEGYIDRRRPVTQGVEQGDFFDALFQYFIEDELSLDKELLEVRDPLNYLEVLADIADAARALALDTSPQAFRNAVSDLLTAIAWQPKLQEITRRYPAFGERNPVALAAREARPEGGSGAQRKIDEIDIVAGFLRDRIRMAPSPSRSERNNLDRYEKKIIAKNGDVHSALWELRKEEMERPAISARQRPFEPRRKTQATPQAQTVEQAHPLAESTPPLSPRSRALSDEIIADLGNPQVPAEYEIREFRPRAPETTGEG